MIIAITRGMKGVDNITLVGYPQWSIWNYFGWFRTRTSE